MILHPAASNRLNINKLCSSYGKSYILKKAFLAAEDAGFYEHHGIDFPSIFRAFFKNIRKGASVQGGSTVTQQVAKSFFLTPERTISRKIKEAVLAYCIDTSS